MLYLVKSFKDERNRSGNQACHVIYEINSSERCQKSYIENFEYKYTKGIILNPITNKHAPSTDRSINKRIYK